jgi:hypothetical protein
LELLFVIITARVPCNLAEMPPGSELASHSLVIATAKLFSREWK